MDKWWASTQPRNPIHRDARIAGLRSKSAPVFGEEPAWRGDSGFQSDHEAVVQLGVKLRELKHDSGLNWSELSSRMHYDSSVIVRALTGNRVPSYDLFASFVKAVGGDSTTLLLMWEQAADALSAQYSRRRRRDDALFVGDPGAGPTDSTYDDTD